MTDEVVLDNQLCFQINRAHQLFNRFYQSPLKEFKLTYVQYTVLLALWERQGVTINQLGDKLGLGTGTLTPLLKRMEVAGWLTRTRSTEDERRVIVELTAKAQQSKAKILQATSDCISRLGFDKATYQETMTTVANIQQRLEQSEKD
ncbi:MarR family winged helix-turn-helix transcriptional regulator [Paucilactobacillus kaifaensis]|uniref:MarR family winged helix-turn-helix transcriptional regulator n=1 Tax=Paucilactobacillus kaifaensis TaxID=2559921 RepID=UPI001485614F|nr:MarR family winged helix-turn-helix transcriptional regulator [Paucilactobacillus kaifaensis]